MADLNHRPFQLGRLGAFDQFVLKHESLIYNVAYRILGDQELATRVTQDTFGRSFPAFAKFHGEFVRLWLLRIVIGICREQLHRELCHHPDSSTGNDVIQACLNALPPEQRITLILSDIQGLSYREIAEIVGVSVAIVNCRLSRGRARLRDELLARGMLLLEAYPAKVGLSPLHASKTVGMRRRTDGILEDRIGHLSQTRIGHTADA